MTMADYYKDIRRRGGIDRGRMVFLHWLVAVFKQWIAEVIGGAVIGLIALYSEISGATVTPRAYEAVVVLALFQAMFLAWRDEHEESVKLNEMLSNLRQNARFGLELFKLGIRADMPSPNGEFPIQFEYGLRNTRPEDALRYKVESETFRIGAKELQLSELLPRRWHGLGPRAEQTYGGGRYDRVRFSESPTTEGTFDLCVLYGISGDAVIYRMQRQLLVTFRRSKPLGYPTIQSWVVLLESDDLAESRTGALPEDRDLGDGPSKC